MPAQQFGIQPDRVVPNRADNQPQTSRQRPIGNQEEGGTNKVMRPKTLNLPQAHRSIM